MTTYRGVNGVNREIKQQFRGVGGVNREIKEQYRGVGGVNRKVFSKDALLYNYGNEMLAITGGWVNNHPYESPLVKNTDNMEKTVSVAWQGVTTASMVSTQGYSKLKILTQPITTGSEARYYFGLATSKNWDVFSINSGFVPMTTTSLTELELDISSVQGNYYVKVQVEAKSKIYKIWLE